MYQPRVYREWVKAGELTSYNVCLQETDLYIRTVTDLSREALATVKIHRQALERYIQAHPFFASSFEPIKIAEEAPIVVRLMGEAAQIAGVGPMAAVAGAMSGLVGEKLAEFSCEVIVENGGDNYLRSSKERIAAIYAGNSPLSGKLGLRIRPEDMPLGICTSSGTVGHSISFGRVDAAVVTASSTALADAAATAIGNVVECVEDIPKALELAQSFHGVLGVVVIKDDRMGSWGKLELCRIGTTGK